MNEKSIATAAEQEYLKLLARMREDILQTIEDLEWAEECDRERDAGIQAANQSLIYGGRYND